MGHPLRETSNHTDDSFAHAKDAETFLRPIVRLMLMCRVSLRSFVAVVTKLYLEEARNALEREASQSGKEPNLTASSLAFEAGMSDVGLAADFLSGKKRSIATIGGFADSEEEAQDLCPPKDLHHSLLRFGGAGSPEGWVLHFWRKDPLFSDGDGRPIPLKKTGSGLTFETLVKRAIDRRQSYGPVLSSLLKAGIVEERDGMLNHLSASTWMGEAISPIDRQDDGSAVVQAPYGTSVPSDDLDGLMSVRTSRGIMWPAQKSNPDVTVEPSKLILDAFKALQLFCGTVADNVEHRFRFPREDPELRCPKRKEFHLATHALDPSDYWIAWELARELLTELGQRFAYLIEESGLEKHPPQPGHLTFGIGAYLFDSRPDLFDPEFAAGYPEWALVPEDFELPSAIEHVRGLIAAKSGGESHDAVGDVDVVDPKT